MKASIFRKFIHVFAIVSIIGMVGYFLPAPSSYANTIYHDFIFPIAIGYILSYVFFIMTVLIPIEYRKQSVRKNIDLTEYEVSNKLFSVFNIIFDNVMYQKQIKAGTLIKEDIKLALQNKCLHKEYIKPDGYAEKFIAIGEKLENISKELESLISQVLIINEFLSEDEINIFFSIRKKLSVYDFYLDKKLYFSPYEAKHQNISYMSDNYYELYLLYVRVQQIVYKNNLNIRDIYFDKIQYLYYSKQFDKVIGLIKKDSIVLQSQDKVWVRQYYMLAKYQIGDKTEAYNILISLLHEDLDIVSWRSIFLDMYDDEVNTILSNNCKKQLIKKMFDMLENEKQTYELFRNCNQYIMDNY
ncbi:hypothetical protein [Anaerocolumna chitinilytica]|uniref:Uncharacterized protein n=1 Tax=Anaerocolumna chitinilytica TaxID=1727145 RepID=A0A7I8DIY8_9FIRM|nr:hypothetical protein [Anaerocolumna chitinilytica]BCJ98458.1 hypothetical protein bsdcttw_14990 [Anaerocolumna chitinilytica]